MRSLARAITGLELPAIEKISEEQAEDPFQILIGTILSARTQDATTHAASTRLFKVARTPRTMAKLPTKRIERLIYPVSFYRNKARHVKACCEMLVTRFGGRVPSTMDELLMLPGVGRKTANLVLILGFQSRANICVDTHVHRISNRLGWVATATPDETEHALYRATGRQWWPYINLYLVTWGQNVCRPVYPRCGDCVIRPECRRIGVKRHPNAQSPRVGDPARRNGHEAYRLGVDGGHADGAVGREHRGAGAKGGAARKAGRRGEAGSGGSGAGRRDGEGDDRN